MRSILSMVFCVILPVLNVQVKAQNCNLNRDRDPYTKEIKISSGFIELDGASVTIDASKDEIDLLFSVDQNKKCFDDNTSAQVFFDSSKVKMTIRNNGSMNCKGIFHFIFKNSTNTPSQLTRLSTTRINHIDLYNSLDMTKKIGSISFPALAQTNFMTLTTCVINEAKTLLQQ